MNKTIQIPDKKVVRIINRLKPQIEKLVKEFFNIRNIIQSGSSHIEKIQKQYNGKLKTEDVTIDEDGQKYVMKSIKICNKDNRFMPILEIMYGHKGISISVGFGNNERGISLIKFYDFDCKSIEQIIYNKYTLTKIKNYNLKINKDGTKEGTLTLMDRPDKSFIGRLLSPNKK